MKLFDTIAVALSLIFIEISASICLHYVPRDDSYYLVCGVFNLLHILILCFFSKSLLVVDMQQLAFVSFLIQWFGFISYHCVINISLYNSAIWVVVFLQILRLFIKRKGDSHGVGAFHSWNFNFFSHGTRRYKINIESEK